MYMQSGTQSMQTLGPYRVTATWDAEARCWVAYSDDVPGLATGADTLDELIEKLKVVVPELLEANGLLPEWNDGPDLPIAVMAETLAPRPDAA